MPQPIIYVDTSEVRPGRLEELKLAMDDLAQFVRANEPQLLAYNVYFTEDGTHMSVVHVNPDSASLESCGERLPRRPRSGPRAAPARSMAVVP